MTLCDNNHVEICFESRKCPLCEMRDDKDGEINLLNAKIEDLEQQLEDEKNRED